MNWEQQHFAQNTVREFERLGRTYERELKVPFVDLRRGVWQPKGNDSKTGTPKWNNMAYGKDIAKEVYIGLTEKKLPSGLGRWSIEGSSRLEYEGIWLEGRPNGHGTFILDGRRVYQGQVLDGRPEGEGTYFWADGMTYWGHLTEGRFDGQGTIRKANMEYRDFWKQGHRSGQGVFSWYLWLGQPPLQALIPA
jgi:hypothetical protein